MSKFPQMTFSGSWRNLKLSVSKYKLHSAIVGVLPDGKLGLRILTIPTGATLTIIGTPNISGLVDAQWDVMLVSVFLRDVTEHGELVEEQSAG